jgi:hypothetical protein
MLVKQSDVVSKKKRCPATDQIQIHARNFKVLQAAHYHTFGSANTTNEFVSIAVILYKIA